VRTWLFGIAVNLARGHVRSERRGRARAAVYLARLPEPGPSPADEAERRQLIVRLRSALESLPYELRVVYLLCDVEGLRGVDVARSLGLRTGTLYRRLHEARLALRTVIEGERR
jgi:RNA polymerase sigma-70 factor (ECF subfamily)